MKFSLNRCCAVFHTATRTTNGSCTESQE